VSVMRNPRRDAELEGGIQGIRDQFRVVLCVRVIEIVDCAEAMVSACEITQDFIGNRASFPKVALAKVSSPSHHAYRTTPLPA
jgi:hypothetical protein